MKLVPFLNTVAQDVGADRLHGAILFLALDRPIDRLIQLALAAGPYHTGAPSPWSHTLLLASDYRGKDTLLLDCTIRSTDGKVLWDAPLKDLLGEDLTKQGGIYDGHLRDYEHPRVTNAGIKLLNDLTSAERALIVAKARDLQAAGYHYDIPGLVRELVHLLAGISIPAGDKLLFCSAFCQAVYRNAIGLKGDFSSTVATTDITPDELWYSPRGTPFPSTRPPTRRDPAQAKPARAAKASAAPRASSETGLAKIDHIVVLMLENRSFDHLLGWLKEENPAIEGVDATTGIPEDPNASPLIPTNVNKSAAYQGDLQVDPGHDQPDVGLELYGTTNYNFDREPTNNGFVLDYFNRNNGDRARARKIMSCFNPQQLGALATLAREFALCDHWFSSLPGPTWPNRFFAHAATSGGFVDNAFRHYAMETIYHRLQSAGVSWSVYFHDIPQVLAISSLWGELFKQRFHRAEEFFKSAKAGTLPGYSFIEPRYFPFFTEKANDEHPPHDIREGETLISDVYNALRASPKWEHTLLVILYDEHGGTFDHVPPPRTVNPDGKVSTTPPFAFTRLGVRVPAVLVSPHIAKGTLDHTIYDHASLIATVRERFGITEPLTVRDANANTFTHVLTLGAPRTDTPTHLAPTGQPVRTPAQRAAAYAPLPPSDAVQAEASTEPLTELQQSLVTLARQLNTHRTPAAQALRAIAPVTNEHQAAIHVKDEVFTFLNR